MTQEDKEILLKYLCMALPYEIIIEYNNDSCVETREMGLGSLHDFMVDNAEVKPYLRSMSSMTDNEFYEVQSIIGSGIEVREFYIDITWSNTNTFSYLEIYELLNYFLENHIDFLGLIPKDLAIEVTKSNNPYKE